MKNCLIMGSGRCGTSMVAGTLAASGYFTGDEPYGPDTTNPKGFFECPEINNINEALLAHQYPDMPHGSRWLIDDSPSKHAPQSFAPLSPELGARIKMLTLRGAYGLKDTRFCRTWPLWLPLLENCVCVCLFRHPAACVDSMLTVNKNFPFKVPLTAEKAERVWNGQYLSLAQKSWTCPWLFMRYDQFFGDGFQKLEEFLEVTLDKNFRDPALDRHTSRCALSPATMTTYRQLCQLAACNPEEPAS